MLSVGASAKAIQHAKKQRKGEGSQRSTKPANTTATTGMTTRIGVQRSKRLGTMKVGARRLIPEEALRALMVEKAA